MKRHSIVGAVFGAAAAMSVAVTAALAFTGVSNGSFELGAYSGAPFDPLGAGSTQITGWTVDTGSVDWVGSYWVAADGSRSVDLNGDGPAALSQGIATTIGNTYSVSFALSGNPVCEPTVKTLTVGASGADAQVFTFDIAAAGNTPSDMKWEPRTYSFVATSATTTLTFTSTTSGVCGPALDNIVVTETVPPPDTEPPTAADCKDDGWQKMTDTAGHVFKNQGDCVSFFATDGSNPAAD